ncbi:RNA 2',3'-cyclic phosphodiesterase [Paucisalibacillus globulus]|uniref:RNA 2',3'-cyclic phosphodiesterase n=1 Tax=Paucisalibacillus globulus TaxID=351095 RepID=UPI000415ED19|nr:RNA 2',3'-cyclic phosphodiesterase [Paucisalibacillus globulus]
MGETPHYFIAIPVSNSLREEFVRWQEQFQENLSYKIWPHKEDLHITLKFFGAVEENRLKKLQESLRSIDYPEFQITVGSIGTFGKQDSPRVLWGGVEINSTIEELFLKVESTAVTAGFSKENRPFRPHITLAKKWNGTYVHAENLRNIRENYKAKIFHMNIKEFVLYQIFPSKTPKYENVETFYLRGESIGPIN